MVWGHGKIDTRLALLAALGLAGCIPGGMTPTSMEPEITEAGQPAAPPLAEPVAGSDAPVWESRSVAPNAADVIGTTYTVQPGDTLRGIGNRTGAGSEAIAAASTGAAPPSAGTGSKDAARTVITFFASADFTVERALPA